MCIEIEAVVSEGAGDKTSWVSRPDVYKQHMLGWQQAGNMWSHHTGTSCCIEQSAHYSYKQKQETLSAISMHIMFYLYFVLRGDMIENFPKNSGPWGSYL